MSRRGQGLEPFNGCFNRLQVNQILCVNTITCRVSLSSTIRFDDFSHTLVVQAVDLIVENDGSRGL